MNNPAPVDINMLSTILGKSKAIMNKVETNNYQKGFIDEGALMNELPDEGTIVEERISRPASQPVGGYTEEMVNKSNLPEAIKRAMIERPIPQMINPSHTFSLDDVADLVDKPKATPRRNVSESRQRKQNSDMITVSKQELAEMVDAIVTEKLLEFFINKNNASITEAAVKKTIGVLIKEGKITQKKKV